MQSFGSCIDWRRSFISTEKNPFYEKFVQWQFLKLKEKGKICFGSKYVIYSEELNRISHPQERSIGEDAVIEEYTLVKLKILNFSNLFPFLNEKETKNVFLLSFAKNVENLFGVTNIWIHHNIYYGIYKMKNGEICICSKQSAKNMSYQKIFEFKGKTNLLGEIRGDKFIGIELESPFCSYKTIYCLPKLFQTDCICSGIYLSVPTESIYDLISLNELKKNKSLREKYKLKEECVSPFDGVHIITSPKLGTFPSEKMCETYKIQTIKDLKNNSGQVEIIKDRIVFGKMIVEQFKNTPVKEARNQIIQILKEKELCYKYCETNVPVYANHKAREACVVSLIDTWYLTYSDENWKNQTKNYIQNLKVFNEEQKSFLYNSLDFIGDWNFIKSDVEGTKLPFEEEKTRIIEKISETTLFMAYCTISHFIQGDYMGSKPGILGLKPEDLTSEFFNYIFFKESEKPKNIPEKSLEILSNEFNYWYPINLHISPLNILQNHSLFVLLHHIALFPQKKLPLSLKINGAIRLNNVKMSKANNYLNLKHSIKKFSADATRFTLAEAGDTQKDGVFNETETMKRFLQIYNELEKVENFETNEKDENYDWIDKVFNEEIEKSIVDTLSHYENYEFSKSVLSSWHLLVSSKNEYSKLKNENFNKKLLKKYFETLALLNAPIIPHFSEMVWKKLGREGLIFNQIFPQTKKIDHTLLESKNHLFQFIKLVRKQMKNKNKKHLIIYIAQSYPSYYIRSIEIVKSSLEENKKFKIDKKSILNLIFQDQQIQKFKKEVQNSIAFMLTQYEKTLDEKILDLQIPFDELSLFIENRQIIVNQLELNKIEILSIDTINQNLPNLKKFSLLRPLYPLFELI